MSEERTGEIWSTRVQQELLALTTDNGDDSATTEARSMLPNYCTVKKHKLDIENGICVVLIQMDLSGKEIMYELDASLKKSPDGKVDTSQSAYPFLPPVPRLSTGSAFFPEGSTIREGGRIPMDLDWTPSLHLTDVVLHVGLKIKESIMQGEPFHSEKEPDLLAEAVDEVAQDLAKGARFFASKIGEKATSLSKAFSPKGGAGLALRQRGFARQTSPKSTATISQVKVGDEINFLEEPWVDAHGVYSCKAIRRPPFVERLLAKPVPKDEQFSSPSSMFRSFAKSARSVMEESFLMVTETHLIEIRANKLNMQNGTVTFCIPIEHMAKLKFRRHESVSLFFKPAPNDPLIYMCPDSGDVVHQIQTVLKRKGVRGKHTNASAYKAINEAMLMVQEIQTKEIAVEHDPSVERVNEIMDLYRQAAEKFEVAGDIRHEEVITHMKMFLAKPSTISVLDGSFKKAQDKTEMFVPEGEVLERPSADEDFDDEETPAKETEEEEDGSHSEEDREFEHNIDTLMKDAKEEFGQFGLSDDDTAETETPTPTSTNDDLADMAADLDALMKEADKELAELMSS